MTQPAVNQTLDNLEFESFVMCYGETGITHIVSNVSHRFPFIFIIIGQIQISQIAFYQELINILTNMYELEHFTMIVVLLFHCCSDCDLFCRKLKSDTDKWWRTTLKLTVCKTIRFIRFYGPISLYFNYLSLYDLSFYNMYLLRNWIHRTRFVFLRFFPSNFGLNIQGSVQKG